MSDNPYLQVSGTTMMPLNEIPLFFLNQSHREHQCDNIVTLEDVANPSKVEVSESNSVVFIQYTRW